MASILTPETPFSGREPAPTAGLPTASAGLSGRRQLLAAAVLVIGLPALIGALGPDREHISYATPVLAVLVLVVVVAMLGGLRLALPAAVLGGLALNWFFTPPYATLQIDHSDQLLALVVYLGVAVAVSTIVDRAARLTAQATRARAEARELSTLAGVTLTGTQTVPAMLERVRCTFGLREVRLLELSGTTWDAAATVSGGEPSPDEMELRIPTAPTLVFCALGPPLSDADQRLLPSFAQAASTVLEGQRLAAQARANAELEAANRMRTALLAAVGHDLRTPLAGVKASVSSLRQPDVEFSDDQRDELLATIEDSADRLQSLVANLLDASRLQAGAVSVQAEPIGLEEVAGRALLELPQDDQERVVLDVPRDLPDVLADQGLLERVLANLLSNAVRHTPSGEVTTVRATTDNGRVRCDVIDRGPGVDVAAQAHMFEAFQRLSDRTPGGVGLGLSVARGFTEAMNGSLVPMRTRGTGLTMRLTLPAARHGIDDTHLTP